MREGFGVGEEKEEEEDVPLGVLGGWTCAREGGRLWVAQITCKCLRNWQGGGSCLGEIMGKDEIKEEDVLHEYREEGRQDPAGTEGWEGGTAMSFCWNKGRSMSLEWDKGKGDELLLGMGKIKEVRQGKGGE